MNTKTAAKEYDSIPAAPQDFDGAVAVHKEACSAIVYWDGEHKAAMFESTKRDAYNWLKRWRRCKGDAAQVISSYQLRLF